MRALVKYRNYHKSVLFFYFLFWLPIFAWAENAVNLAPEELITKLQQGGYIIYLRHAATDHAQRDIDLSDLSQCELQRNLSEQGITESKMLGQALQKLNIKVDQVYSSPYCRCVDTARIAFGRYQIVNQMRATFATNQNETRQLVEFLSKQLSQIPKTGFNTVLVGHTANLRELTRVWPKPEGVAHVFKPLENGGYQHMGRIIPSLWRELAGFK